MKSARERMAEIFSQSTVKAQTPICGYVPNRTARLTQESGVVFELLVEQIDHPVLWKQTMTSLLEQNYLGTLNLVQEKF